MELRYEGICSVYTELRKPVHQAPKSLGSYSLFSWTVSYSFIVDRVSVQKKMLRVRSILILLSLLLPAGDQERKEGISALKDHVYDIVVQLRN